MAQPAWIPIAAGSVFGLFVGAAAALLVARRWVEMAATRAKSESQMETACLNERLDESDASD